MSEHDTADEPEAEAEAEPEYQSDDEQIAADVPAEAAETIAARGSHGEAVENHDHLAQLWNAYFAGVDGDFDSTDVANMMILTKMSRSVKGDRIRDHFVDMAGYAGIAYACEQADGGDGDDIAERLSIDVSATVEEIADGLGDELRSHGFGGGGGGDDDGDDDDLDADVIELPEIEHRDGAPHRGHTEGARLRFFSFRDTRVGEVDGVDAEGRYIIGGVDAGDGSGPLTYAVPTDRVVEAVDPAPPIVAPLADDWQPSDVDGLEERDDDSRGPAGFPVETNANVRMWPTPGDDPTLCLSTPSTEMNDRQTSMCVTADDLRSIADDGEQAETGPAVTVGQNTADGLHTLTSAALRRDAVSEIYASEAGLRALADAGERYYADSDDGDEPEEGDVITSARGMTLEHTDAVLYDYQISAAGLSDAGMGYTYADAAGLWKLADAAGVDLSGGLPEIDELPPTEVNGIDVGPDEEHEYDDDVKLSTGLTENGSENHIYAGAEDLVELAVIAENHAEPEPEPEPEPEAGDEIASVRGYSLRVADGDAPREYELETYGGVYMTPEELRELAEAAGVDELPDIGAVPPERVGRVWIDPDDEHPDDNDVLLTHGVQDGRAEYFDVSAPDLAVLAKLAENNRDLVCGVPVDELESDPSTLRELASEADDRDDILDLRSAHLQIARDFERLAGRQSGEI